MTTRAEALREDERAHVQGPPPAAGQAHVPGVPPAAAGRRAMRASAAVATALATDGRTVISRLASAPPLTLRQTGPHTVHLVSTAAGPLGGDRLALHLDVAPHTMLELGSVAATLVLPGEGPSELLVTARVGAGATLRFAPEPTVLAAGCDHRLLVRLALEADASVLWREEIVFGRHGEAPGRCHARFDAIRDGLPLLRQEFTVGDPALDASPAVYGPARCVGTTFLTTGVKEAALAEGVAVLPLAAPATPAPVPAQAPATRASLPAQPPATLVSALAADAVQLRARLEWGERTAAGGNPPHPHQSERSGAAAPK
ncbi:urease accessory protein UreD [Nonomuraea composti]|nr:urease accessory protein UreD [Nonomuraea sp. FMUSA5-5]